MSNLKTLLFSTIFLGGCVAKTPTQTIIDQHIHLVDDAIVGIEMSEEAKNALKTCRAGLLAAEESYKSELSSYKADIRYWKAVSFFLFALMILYFGYKVMKP